MEEQNPKTEEKVPMTKEEKSRAFRADMYDWMQCIVSALLTCVLAFVFVGRVIGVIGSSMEPTLYWGDKLVISNLFYTPEQGDIVVFRPDIEGKEELWIKRIIALEGQTVYIDPNDFRVYVDGQPLDESYLPPSVGTYPHTTANPITVPEGHVYVLGDNRGVSHDSRYEDLGCVSLSRLAGRVIVRFWPFSSFEFYG